MSRSDAIEELDANSAVFSTAVFSSAVFSSALAATVCTEHLHHRCQMLRRTRPRRRSPGLRTLCLLFAGITIAQDAGRRLFAVAEDTGTFDATHCARCEGLQYCTAMNGKLFFDPVYGYTREATTQLEKQGACEDLDAKTLELSHFGDQFQFKDTAACRSLVWNYHCLSWAAATFQRAMNGVAVSCSSSSTDGASLVPLPPCRSLCVEVADNCVYSHFYRTYLENVCGNVPCVSEEEEALTANTSSPKKQQDCVKAKWETAPNTTFSRCSIRAYEPPQAVATALSATLWRMVVCFQIVLWLYSIII